jgi:calcineurin-like phosphoesterase family protein
MMYDYAVAAIEGNKAQMEEIASEFEKSSCGVLGWLSAAFDYMVAQAEVWKSIPYVEAPTPPDNSFVYSLPEQDSFRIGILGDWGTGEPVAQLVINAMMACNLDLIIHVGDVYYAGTTDEVQSNYVNMIAAARESCGSMVPIYNLPGNHDYYTKGKPFFDALACINTGTAFPNSPSTSVPVQGASFFSLCNSWLQLQGMDTGYYDSDLWDVSNDTTMLHTDEAAWHLQQLNDAESAGRTVFLFSHHQPWSAFLGIGTGTGIAGDAEAIASMQMASYNVNLQAQLANVPLDTVRAWFWGHEHVLEVSDSSVIANSTVPTVVNGAPASVPLSSLFPWVPYGACIGFSAFPMLDTDNPYGVVAPGIQFNSEYVLGTTTSNNATVYNHGFTVLEVAKNGTERPTATATYYSLPGDGSSSTATAFPASTIS